MQCSCRRRDQVTQLRAGRDQDRRTQKMTDDKRLWPRFSPEINFGHLLQAGVIVVTIGGGAITSYLSLRSDIQQVRADLTVRVSEHELRIATIEHASEDQRKEMREFQTEMRASITRIFDLLTDLRVQFGQRRGWGSLCRASSVRRTPGPHVRALD